MIEIYGLSNNSQWIGGTILARGKTGSVLSGGNCVTHSAVLQFPELLDEVIAAYTDSIPLTGFLTRAIGLAF